MASSSAVLFASSFTCSIQGSSAAGCIVPLGMFSYLQIDWCILSKMSKSDITWSKFRFPSGSCGPHAASVRSVIMNMIFFMLFVCLYLYLNLDACEFTTFLNRHCQYCGYVESD